MAKSPISPWRITPSAVRDYLWLTNQPDAVDGPLFERARVELQAAAAERVASLNPPKELPSGLLQYRLGRAHGRIYLIVGADEGRPAVVACEAGSEAEKQRRGEATWRRRSRE